MATRRSLFTFQPVIRGNVTQKVLDVPDPGMIGDAIDIAPHAITNQPSEREYVPVQAADQPPTTIKYRARQATSIGYSPFLFRSQLQEEQTAPPQAVQSSAQGLTGVIPDPLALEEHGPVTDLDIAKLAGQPASKSTVWARLRDVGKRKDNNKARTEDVIPQIGTDSAKTRAPIESDAATNVYNVFQLPDVRRTFDTPNVAGVTKMPDGTPYPGKAGYPLTASWHEAMKYDIQNVRIPVVNNAYPFLPDRVRAGTADPRDVSQTRAAFEPHWWFARPFDKGIADRLTGQKGVVSPPEVARPIITYEESLPTQIGPGALGGNRRMTGAPGMTPAGTMPNTARDVPQPWDFDLVSGGSEPAPFRKWGLR